MTHTLANWLMRRLGWQVQGKLPKRQSYVLVAGPHTSNWDFVLGILARTALGERIRFLGKHQLFRFPVGWFFRWLGGYPVHRHQQNNLVEQVVAYFKNEPGFVLGLAPEGTRSPVTRWKLGFYHIAKAAAVPYVLVGFDYQKKCFVISEPIYPGDDMATDLAQIAAFYKSVQGKYSKKVPDYLGYPPAS